MPETRHRIVAATAELFRSQGYNGTSLKQVTLQASAPTGSIYHFFPGGKTELGAVVIRESGASYQQLFEMIADEATDIAAAMIDFFNGAADALEETDFIDICPIGNVAREVASTHESLREATVDVFAGWNAAISTRLEAAGVAPAEAKPLADTIIATIEGGFMLARANRSCDALRISGTHMHRLVSDAIS